MHAKAVESEKALISIKNTFKNISVEPQALNYLNDSLAHIRKEKSDVENIKSRVTQGELVTTQTTTYKPVVSGILYSIGKHTGIDIGFLRIAFVIGIFVFFPIVFIYGGLALLKSFLQNNS